MWLNTMPCNVLRLRRSDYGKTHRKAYEYGHSREYGGMSSMVERYPSTDGKSGPLTTVLKDNLVICYVPA